MNRVTKYLAAGSIILILTSFIAVSANRVSFSIDISKDLYSYYAPQDTSENDSIDLQYPFREDPNSPFSDVGSTSPLFLRNPSNIRSNIEYDPTTNTYVFSEKVGQLNYRPSTTMSLDEYRRFEMEQAKRDYWAQRRSGESPDMQKQVCSI